MQTRLTFNLAQTPQTNNTEVSRLSLARGVLQCALCAAGPDIVNCKLCCGAPSMEHSTWLSSHCALFGRRIERRLEIDSVKIAQISPILHSIRYWLHDDDNTDSIHHVDLEMFWFFFVEAFGSIWLYYKWIVAFNSRHFDTSTWNVYIGTQQCMGSICIYI